MRYVWEAGKDDEEMHICGHNPVTGQATLKAFCGIDRRFNRSINPPFGLGRETCKDCERKVEELRARR